MGAKRKKKKERKRKKRKCYNYWVCTSNTCEALHTACQVRAEELDKTNVILVAADCQRKDK
jgi:hypothetical protein